MADRFQFVWWGLAVWRRPRVHRWEGGLALIYDWSFVCGPFELRRWHQRRPTFSVHGARDE